MPSPRNLGPLFSAVRDCQQQPKHTVIIAPTRLHGLTIICKFDLMKRKHVEWDNQSPRDSARQNCLAYPYAQSAATPSLLFTERTPPTPCCQHCAERCSRASPTPSPPQKRHARALRRRAPLLLRLSTLRCCPTPSLVFALAVGGPSFRSPRLLDIRLGREAR